MERGGTEGSAEPEQPRFPSVSVGHPVGCGSKQPRGCYITPPAAAPDSPGSARGGDGAAFPLPRLPTPARVIYEPQVFKLNRN